jgi:hypothetical protein
MTAGHTGFWTGLASVIQQGRCEVRVHLRPLICRSRRTVAWQTRSSPVDTSTGKHRRTIKLNVACQYQTGIQANQLCLCPSHDEVPHVRSNPAGDREEQSRGSKFRKVIRAGYLRHGNHRCCCTCARYGQQRPHALRGWQQNLTADLAEGPKAPRRQVIKAKGMNPG